MKMDPAAVQRNPRARCIAMLRAHSLAVTRRASDSHSGITPADLAVLLMYIKDPARLVP